MKENAHKVLVTLGTKNGSQKFQEPNGFYSTDPAATKKLVKWLEENYPDCKNWKIWESFCGNGAITKVLEENGFNVVANSDLIDRGFGDTGIDFFKETEMRNGSDTIISNPPYKLAQASVEKALDLMKDGDKLIFLLRVQFLEGKSRKKLFEKHPPKFVLVNSERVNCWKDGVDDGSSSAICYCQYVWEKGYKGDTIIKWL